MPKKDFVIYNDLHLFEKECHEHGIEAFYLLVDDIEPRVEQSTLEFDDIVLRHIYLNCKTQQNLTISPEWTTFAFIKELHPQTLWEGFSPHPYSYSIALENTQHQLFTQRDHEAIEIDVHNSVLDSINFFEHPLFHESTLENTQLHFKFPPYYIVREWEKLENIFRLIEQPKSEEEKNRQFTELRQRLIETVTQVFKDRDTASSGFESGQLVKSYALVNEVITRVTEQPAENFTINEIAEGHGVTTRTLQNAFERVLNVSPKQYLLYNKLDQSRRYLMANHHSGSIAQIAKELGFASTSRFSEYLKSVTESLPPNSLKNFAEVPEYWLLSN